MTAGWLIVFASLRFDPHTYLRDWLDYTGWSVIGAACGLGYSFRIRAAAIGAAIAFMVTLASRYFTM